MSRVQAALSVPMGQAGVSLGGLPLLGAGPEEEVQDTSAEDAEADTRPTKDRGAADEGISVDPAAIEEAPGAPPDDGETAEGLPESRAGKALMTE